MATLELYHYLETDHTNRTVVALFARSAADHDETEIFVEWVLHADGSCVLGPRHFGCLPNERAPMVKAVARAQRG